MNCSCCGQQRDPDTLVELQCHPDVKICRGCIQWLRFRSGALVVTPTIAVADMPQAIAFYESAGFEIERYDDRFAFVHHGDEESVLHLAVADEMEPARNGGGCYIVVPDVDEWHGRLTAAGHPVTPLETMPWGMREFSVTDPSGNRLRIGHSAG